MLVKGAPYNVFEFEFQLVPSIFFRLETLDKCYFDGMWYDGCDRLCLL